MKRNALMRCAILGFMVALGGHAALAQIENQIEINVPFPFYVENTQLPPGRYIIRRADETDPTLLEMRSADGKTAVFIKGIAAQATNPPEKTALVFKKYGDQEILSQIWEAANTWGLEIPHSRTEDRAAAKGGGTAQKHSVEGMSKKR